jgi:hypothetical protein
MKVKLLLICLLSGISFARAQSISPATTNMTGGYLNAGYYQYEYSVGDIVIETLISAGNIATNGVLQPLTDKPFGNNTASAWSNDEIKIFPVPTRGQFEVDVLSKQRGRLRIQLVDGAGHVLSSVEADYYGLGRIERFNISNAASGTYHLRITLDPLPGSVKKSGAFSILKVN